MKIGDIGEMGEKIGKIGESIGESQFQRRILNS